MGQLLGKQWQPRDIASALYGAGWVDAKHLQQALQVILAESQGYDRAFNDNVGSDGKTTSRDVGIMQISIPASQIGTNVEMALYDVPTNIRAGRALYEARGFQPWVAWNTRICFRDTYVKRAARGVGNFLASQAIAQPADANANARYLADPVLDFSYRLAGMLASLHAAHHDLQHMRLNLSETKWEALDRVLVEIAKGLAYKTK